MKESEAKDPKISATWWNSKKSKSLKDVKFGGALAAYESMVKAGELKNQLTQLDILLNLIDPTKRLLTDPKTQRETGLALDNYVLVFKKEKSLVSAKLKEIQKERSGLELELDAMLEKHTKLMSPHFVAMNKIFASLRLIHQKTTSLKGELDEKIRIKMLEQIKNLTDDTFKRESDMKLAIKNLTKDAQIWVTGFGKLPGETVQSGSAHWQAQPQQKELLRLKKEFDEQVEWVRENARKISGGDALKET